MGLKLGHKWPNIEEGVFHVITISLPSVSILITVGMIVGVWIASGTVPTLIYYGLKVLSPELFLAAGMVLCARLSRCLARHLLGHRRHRGSGPDGDRRGVRHPDVLDRRCAVVSGAFFGDKISPLSDTTNLAPAVTGTNLFDHIRNMLPTTIPCDADCAGDLSGGGVHPDRHIADVSFERIDAITDPRWTMPFWISPI